MKTLSTLEVQSILAWLPDWKIKHHHHENHNGNFLSDDEIEHLDSNFLVSIEEVTLVYNLAFNEVKQYIYPNEMTDELVSEIDSMIYQWTAGLLYKKHNIKATELVDESYPTGYGDNLLKQAKNGLLPYRSRIHFI